MLGQATLMRSDDNMNHGVVVKYIQEKKMKSIHEEGFKPSTHGLSSRCSTTELQVPKKRARFRERPPGPYLSIMHDFRGRELGAGVHSLTYDLPQLYSCGSSSQRSTSVG